MIIREDRPLRDDVGQIAVRDLRIINEEPQELDTKLGVRERSARASSSTQLKASEAIINQSTNRSINQPTNQSTTNKPTTGPSFIRTINMNGKEVEKLTPH
jgi:hypothetical protein